MTQDDLVKEIQELINGRIEKDQETSLSWLTDVVLEQHPEISREYARDTALQVMRRFDPKPATPAEALEHAAELEQFLAWREQARKVDDRTFAGVPSSSGKDS